MKDSKSILQDVLQLKPQDRFILIDMIIQSLDNPDKKIDAIWAEEAEKRLNAHRKGTTQGVLFEEVFGEDL